MAWVQKDTSRAVSQTSTPWWDLSHWRSLPTRLMSETGTRKKAGRQSGDPVKRRLRPGVEDLVLCEGVEPGFFVGRRKF